MSFANELLAHGALIVASSPHIAFGQPNVPDPAPAAPPGVSNSIGTLLSWWKYAAIVAGVFGLTGCAVMMMLGRRNRSAMAAEGATGIPWVLAGLTVVALSSGIVGVFS